MNSFAACTNKGSLFAFSKSFKNAFTVGHFFFFCLVISPITQLLYLNITPKSSQFLLIRSTIEELWTFWFKMKQHQKKYYRSLFVIIVLIVATAVVLNHARLPSGNSGSNDLVGMTVSHLWNEFCLTRMFMEDCWKTNLFYVIL